MRTLCTEIVEENFSVTRIAEEAFQIGHYDEPESDSDMD